MVTVVAESDETESVRAPSVIVPPLVTVPPERPDPAALISSVFAPVVMDPPTLVISPEAVMAPLSVNELELLMVVMAVPLAVRVPVLTMEPVRVPVMETVPEVVMSPVTFGATTRLVEPTMEPAPAKVPVVAKAIESVPFEIDDTVSALAPGVMVPVLVIAPAIRLPPRESEPEFDNVPTVPCAETIPEVTRFGVFEIAETERPAPVPLSAAELPEVPERVAMDPAA